MAVAANTPIELIDRVYSTLDERLATGRQRLGRALTLAEKILINHLDDPEAHPARRAWPAHSAPGGAAELPSRVP